MQITVYVLVLTAIIILDLIGVIGAIAPAIPGPPLCLIGLVIAYFYFPSKISATFLIVMTILCLVAATIDYFAPMIVTKLGGGSKYAIVGSTIGIIVGIFFPPFGIIWIPFVGALLGEFIANFKIGKAVKVAFLSFLSFIVTVGFKLVLCSVISFVNISACF